MWRLLLNARTLRAIQYPPHSSRRSPGIHRRMAQTRGLSVGAVYGEIELPERIGDEILA
jgi:hypothetical protein